MKLGLDFEFLKRLGNLILLNVALNLKIWGAIVRFPAKL